MKKYKSILLLLLIGILVVSCSLEEEPYGFLNEKNFYNSEEDAESAILYAYAVLPELGYYSRYYYYVAHCSTEEFTQKSDAGAGQHELDGYLTTNTTEDLREVFRHCYISINRTFPIIDEVPKVNMNEAYRDQIVGEAHFLRALNYYNLVRLFGQIPLRTTIIENHESVGTPLASIEEIYNYIIEDLQAAESLMDMTPRRGRANKVAAQGLLANVYLFLASASESGLDGYSFASSGDYYSKAATEADKVITQQSTFGFDNSMFNIFDPTNESSPELIFSLIVSRTEMEPTNLQSLLSTPYCDGNYFTLPSELGGYSIDYGWDHVWVEMPFYNSFADNDLRKQTYFCDSITVGDNAELWTLNNGRLSRPFTIKYLDADRTGGDTGGNRISIVRFSEVLLTYAEANGLNNDGLTALNQVRQRAGLTPYLLSDFANDDDFRDAVLQERSWELCYEYQRLYDLRRTGKMEEILGTGYGKSLNQNVYFFPIPKDEIDRNPALDQ